MRAGFPLIAGDPSRCYLTEQKVFIESPRHVRVTTPKPNAVLGKQFLLEGEARAIGNEVSYQLKDEHESVIASGTIPVTSPDLGRFGKFSQAILLDNTGVIRGILEVFEKTPAGERESVISLPITIDPSSNAEASPSIRLQNTNVPSVSPSPIAQDSEFDPLANLPQNYPKSASLQVPFTPQAPFADWNPPFDEACEEASIIMVKYYLEGDELSLSTANNEIVLLTDWAEKHGYKVDITTTETAAIAKAYYGINAKAYTGDEVTSENIKRFIAAGYPVIIPAAGQLLGNPYFRGAGPPYHMLVITGYDERTFRTNDPGTKRGEGHEYSQSVIMNAIHDWNSTKEQIEQGQKAMLVLGL